MEKWGKILWALKGSLNVMEMGKRFLLLQVADPKEVEWVLKNGQRILKGKYLHLERWNHIVGCIESSEQVKEA